MSTTLILLATAVLLAALAVIGWRNRETPSARAFAALQSLATVWVGMTVVGLQLSHGPLRLRVWAIVTGLSLLSTVLWLAFILAYTGRSEWVQSGWFAAVATPLVAGAVTYAVAPTWEPLVGGLTEASIPAGTVITSSVGPVGAALGLYIYGVFFTGFVVVAKTVLERDKLFLGQASALVLGTLVTVLGSMGSIVGFPVDGFPATQVALGPESLLFGYAVFRTKFLDQVPAVARIGERAVFQDLDDGVVVVGDDTVLQANPRAHAYLDADDLAGTPLSAVFEEMGVDSLSDYPARFQRRGRTYQAKVSSVTDWRDREVGRTLVIRDVTQLVRRQERLSVLNRILRHNLRNDLNVILGFAAQIEHESGDDVATLGEKVSRKARSLSSISEKALEVERMFDRESEARSVDVESLVTDVVSSLADQHPEATVETDVEGGEVQTYPRLFAVVLREVVENALVHSGSAPSVTVDVSTTDHRVELVVTDDGPGIPRAELDPIQSGEETPLSHASSLGMWLVSWGTRSLGGTVDFRTSSEGSTVRISVPDRRTFETDVPVAPTESA
ncbi:MULTISPECIES: histidine kinase N-terminal 7TM domain-containing protein [Salinibaculum]|uniref:sensor histidine kinase n=1 Tax=Salinibaculum TaxID=2732368 RepID=UPI0030CB58A3